MDIAAARNEANEYFKQKAHEVGAYVPHEFEMGQRVIWEEIKENIDCLLEFAACGKFIIEGDVIVQGSMKEKEEKCCRNCRYWDLEFEGRPYDVKREEMAFPEHGQCLKAPMYNCYEKDCPTEEDPMIALDGSMYMALLMTKENHCCNEWKPKEQKS